MNIPEEHLGLPYSHFLVQIAERRNVQTYLEVGVQQGAIFEVVPARLAVGVDPMFALDRNITRKKKTTILIQEPSDVFFQSDYYKSLLGGPPDLSFLDGMHTFEFLLRDFYNTERLSTRSSLIAMHDCLPLTAMMASRDSQFAIGSSQGTKFAGWWTGDVWKTVAILKKYRPDLKVVCVNCPPTGLVCVTNLDPSSTLLEDKYLDIVEEYRSLGNEEDELEEFYASIEIIDAASILYKFDQSLYFRV